MSGGHFRAEDVAARTLRTALVWGFGVVGVAQAGAWVGARYAAGLGCTVSAWLYARGPFAVLPAEIGGGRPVEERVIIDGAGFLADVVRLGDGWRVIIASDCVTLGGRDPARPLVLHRPARPVAAPDAPESSRREGRGGDV